MMAFFGSALKRLLLFQFVFVFAYYKLIELSKSSYDFKDRIYELSKFSDFRHPLVDKVLMNPIPVFQAFIGIQVFCALFAVLGFRFFSFLSGIFMIFTSLVYYSPIKSIITGVPAKFLLESSSMEFLFSIALVLAIFAQALTSSGSEKSASVVIEKKEEDAEPITSKPSDHKRDSRPQSKKYKKHL